MYYRVYDKDVNEPALIFRATQDTIALQVLEGDWVPTSDELVKIQKVIKQAFPDRAVQVIGSSDVVDLRRSTPKT